MKRFIGGILMLVLCTAAWAQQWPSRPIRVLVGFAPGGTSDVSARVTAEILSKELGQQVIVENRPGGAGSVAIEALIRGPKDGYTVVVNSDSSYYQPVLTPSLPYRAERDLQSVAILTNQPIVIAVHPAPGWKSINDLLKAAKAQPGQIAYALSSATGTQAVAAGIFFQGAGVKMIGVPYKGGGQAVVDLVSGHVPVAVLGSAPLVPQVKAGRVRLLAVTSGQRSKALPDVPTLAELGFKFMDISQWFGAVLPMGTPADVVNRMSLAYNKALADPKTQQRLFEAALETVGGTPDEMTKRMAVETVLWSKAAREAGLGAK
jgi:tripartite-type tricarboxylate transporter receptor subunit TctC